LHDAKIRAKKLNFGGMHTTKIRRLWPIFCPYAIAVVFTGVRTLRVDNPLIFNPVVE